MALDLEKISEELRKFADSDEGKEWCENYFRREDEIRKINSLQIKRFHKKYGNNLSEIIEKIITKYNSSEYGKRYFNRGEEPTESLYWFLLDYAGKYGKEIKFTKKNIEKYSDYLNTFTGEAYIIDKYFIQCMHGQGSCVLIERL